MKKIPVQFFAQFFSRPARKGSVKTAPGDERAAQTAERAAALRNVKIEVEPQFAPPAEGSG